MSLVQGTCYWQLISFFTSWWQAICCLFWCFWPVQITHLFISVSFCTESKHLVHTLCANEVLEQMALFTGWNWLSTQRLWGVYCAGSIWIPMVLITWFDVTILLPAPSCCAASLWRSSPHTGVLTPYDCLLSVIVIKYQPLCNAYLNDLILAISMIFILFC